MRFLILALCALSVVGCVDDLSSAEEGFAAVEVTGALHVPLTGQGEDGKSYRLRGASFDVSGSAMFTLTERDARGPEHDALVTTLPGGYYSLFLRPGWTLVEVLADGSEQKIEGTLESKNPVTFEIGRTVDTRVVIQLETERGKVVIGGTAPLRVTQVDSVL